MAYGQKLFKTFFISLKFLNSLILFCTSFMLSYLRISIVDSPSSIIFVFSLSHITTCQKKGLKIPEKNETAEH